ncbi:ASKHA domain-containing protein [candidate division NPL-UPA2 bacterium]|nr:ASKHA domain-containing protein [candidate division NPL-UPA2 bacterium]
MEIKVTFEPGGREVYVLPRTSIIEAAARAGMVIESPCGGNGVCGKCLVEVKEGRSEPTAVEKKIITEKDLKKGIRLACQSKIFGPSHIHIPLNSRFSAQRIVTAGLEERKEVKPAVWKVYLDLPKPSLKHQRADLELIRQSLPHEFRADIYIIRRLSQLLRESDFKVTCVFSDTELISVEKGDTFKDNYGLAFDLGTTTVVGTLLDISSGQDLAVSARMNPQVVHGDDVISRINFIKSEREGLRKIHLEMVEVVNEMIEELTGRAGVSRENIYKMTVVGNSTMQHLFLEVSPENLGSIPFSPVIKEGVEVKAKKLGLEINPDGSAFLFPNIAGFVGGDTVSVILASGLFRSEEIKLAVDIGTNGEIVLGNRDRLITASTAAGPAFEGGRISRGMRASPGAIEKVIMDEDVKVNVVGDAAPSGICGSGLIDVMAEMLKIGIIDESGRILSRDQLKGKVSDSILNRIVSGNGYNHFLLVEEKLTQHNSPILITQKDVRELQLAKGAIAAGIKILEKELGIKDEDISQVLLAGAFGNFIRRSNAKRIGLIPNLPSDRIKFIGNAASSGAKLALLSRDLKEEVESISKETDYIELSARADFQEEFAMAMGFRWR